MDPTKTILIKCGDVEIEVPRTPYAVVFNSSNENIVNDKFIDLYIPSIVHSISIQKLHKIVSNSKLNISKPHIIDRLKKEIFKYGTNTFVWNSLSKNMEYTYYQLRKRSWPVKKCNNMTWQQTAVKIGAALHVYDPVTKKRIVSQQDEHKGDHECKEMILNILEPEEEFQDEKDETLLMKLLDNKMRITNIKDTLQAKTNYAVYGMPEVKEDDGKILCLVKCLIALDRIDLVILLLCRLFVSREHLHYAIKNEDIMVLLRQTMMFHPGTYKIISYCMRYSSYLLLKEERLVGQKIHKDNRSIFTEAQFRELPTFNNVELEDNPYFAEIPDDNSDVSLRAKIIMLVPGERRFTTRREFVQRMNLVNKGVISVDLKAYDSYVTGSSLVPCNTVTPLEEKFKIRKFEDYKNAGDGKTTDESFIKYCEEYYPSYASISSYLSNYNDKRKSLIDTVAEIQTNDFEKNKLNDLHRTDLIDKLNEYDITDQKFIDAKNEYITVMESLEEKEGTLSDTDIGIHAISFADYEKKVFGIFKEIKKNILKDDPNASIYLVKQKTMYKYKWVAKGYNRPIDFFKVSVSAHALVFRFHLNIVKFWWDGHIVRGLYSGICAALTGVNQWYRWFSNNKDPINIVLKNMKRSFTTILNQKEIEILKDYIKETNKYKEVSYGKTHIDNPFFGNSKHPMKKTQYWPDHKTYNARVLCDLKFTDKGKIIPPTIAAFESLINDAL